MIQQQPQSIRMESGEGSNRSFFKHVFNFDDDSKSEVLNILQYALLAILPVISLNKLIARYLPEADNHKGTIEIVAEIVIQVMVMFMGLLLIHRVITFIPTYSAVKYPDFHIVYIVLAVLMITMSLQTKLGEKVSILSERAQELWSGKPEKKKGAKQGGNGGVRVSQPLSGQGAAQMALGGGGGGAGSMSGTDISALPSSVQQLPNYDNMYRNDANPLVGAATPGVESMGMMNEPMAANAVLGGSSFATW